MLVEKDAFIEKLLKQMNSYGDVVVDWNGKREEIILGAIEEKGVGDGVEETWGLSRQPDDKKDDQNQP